MRYGSVCSGIEAATVAWHPLGWDAAWFAEIEQFPCAVLSHHYPDVPNLGNMTLIADSVRSGTVEAPDMLVGGTPCQAFSVAGLRNSLEDNRGQLTLEYIRIFDAIDDVRIDAGSDPAVCVWENVPGVLNTSDNAFGCFLGGLVGANAALVPPNIGGGRWTGSGMVVGPRRKAAWRILDAKHFGVPQRRRRIFVIASARDGFNPAAVLFEQRSMHGDFKESRSEGKVAPTIPSRSSAGGGLGTDFDCDSGLITYCAEVSSVDAKNNVDRGDAQHLDPLICLAHGQANAEIVSDGSPSLTCNHEAPIVSYGIPGNWIGRKPENGGNATEPMLEVSPCQTKTDIHAVVVAHTKQEPMAFTQNQCGDLLTGDVSPSMGTNQNATGRNTPKVMAAMQVRRLTPVECSRLQGFPDDYLPLVTFRGKCPPSDGPMYKALGNSMAVPVMAWIGRRIQSVVQGRKA